jgi:DNA polymerase family A
VFLAAKEKGQMPKHIAPAVVHCTADLTAYLGYPRSLKEACKHLLNKEISKETRDQMKGKRWCNMSEEFKAKVIEYGMDDARYPLQIWQQHSHKWPEWERELSRLTRHMGQTGVAVDKTYVESCVGNLRRLLWEADKQIPWAQTGPALSYKKLCEACRAAGIMPPPSLAMDDEGCAAWEEQHGDKYPWVFAMRTKRRANTLLKKFEALLQRIREDGRVAMPLKYCGAHTRRWSGDSGINAQNMSREAMLADEMKHFNISDQGVELRAAVIAPAGRKLIASDLSQIEPRVLAVLSGNTRMIELLRSGVDIYEAHARDTMGYDRPEKLKSLANIPEFELMRRLSKARVLGLGFQCGWHKFVTFAKTTLGSPDAFNAIFGAPVKPRQLEAFKEALVARRDPILLAEWKRLDEFTQRTWVNSWIQVTDFREKNPHTVALWRKLQALIERSVGEDMVVKLPSGNNLTYHGVHTTPGKTASDGKGYACHLSRTGRMVRVHIYGGLLVENCLAGDTEVLSLKRGWVCLDSLTSDDAVWDGEEFVTHEGLLEQGIQPTIDCHGVRATEDHEFLVNGEWVTAKNLVGAHAVPASERTVFDIKNCGPRHRFAVRGRDGKILIAHNCVQATARDVFATGLLRIAKAGHTLVLQTHDEAVPEVDEALHKQAIVDLMTVVPDWMPTLPLAAEAAEGKTYAI